MPGDRARRTCTRSQPFSANAIASFAVAFQHCRPLPLPCALDTLADDRVLLLCVLQLSSGTSVPLATLAQLDIVALAVRNHILLVVCRRPLVAIAPLATRAGPGPCIGRAPLATLAVELMLVAIAVQLVQFLLAYAFATLVAF